MYLMLLIINFMFLFVIENKNIIVTAFEKLESIKESKFSKWIECLERNLGINKIQIIFLEFSSALRWKQRQRNLYMMKWDARIS